MTWLVTGTATEVELTFTALGPALTQVAVEHRGWEALSDAQLSADCALHGGYAGGAFAAAGPPSSAGSLPASTCRRPPGCRTNVTMRRTS